MVGRAIFSVSLLSFAMLVAMIRYVETSMPVGGDPWMVGDWLINYGGGFVRRGMFGHLFLTVAPGGMPGLWVLFALQASIYFVIFGFCIRALHLSRYSWSMIALVCSPAGLAFIGWVPSIDAAFRKELLPLLALLLLALTRAPHRRSPAIVVGVLASLALFTLGVFSWEASALLLPAYGYLLLAPGAPVPSLDIFRRSLAMVFGAVGGIGAILSALVHGDVATADAVCATARDHGFTGPILCSGGVDASGGAIEAIGWTSYKTTQDLAIAAPVYAGFVVLIILAFIPVVTSRWFRRNWGWGTLIFLGVSPLYFVVTDYGRWTHIIFMAMMMCIVADGPGGAQSRLWNGVGATMYTTLWGMPHWMGEAQLGSTWWPFVGGLPKAIETASDRMWMAGGSAGATSPALAAAAAAKAADPGAVIDPVSVAFPQIAFPPGVSGANLEAAWRFLVGIPSNALDSWLPMYAALEHLRERGEGLYQSVFFESSIKFQYAPTSLLFVELPDLFWPANFGWVMNAVGWLAVVMTAFGVFMILRHYVERLVAPRWSDARTTVLLLVISAAATLAFYPVIHAWNLGQLQVFINLICTWALYSYLRGQSSLAGVAIAVAVLMKPQLGLFLIWGLVRRDWKFVVAGTSTGLVGGIASLALYGWNNHVEYLRVLSFLSQRGEVYYPNQSVNGLLQRWVGNGDPFVFDMFGFPDFHPFVYAWTLVATVGFVAIALVVALLRPKPGDIGGEVRRAVGAAPLTQDERRAAHAAADVRAIDFSVALLCFTIASPIAWEHHYGVLLGVFAVAVCTALSQRRAVAVTLVAALSASYLLITIVWMPLLPSFGPGLILLSHMLFGAVLLLGCLLALRWLVTQDAAGERADPMAITSARRAIT